MKFIDHVTHKHITSTLNTLTNNLHLNIYLIILNYNNYKLNNIYLNNRYKIK